MDLPKSEYLDEEFFMEQSRKTKRKTTPKTKQALPVKLGKYTLTANAINETEVLPINIPDDEEIFELVEVLEEHKNDVSAAGCSMLEKKDYKILNETYNVAKTEEDADNGELSDDEVSEDNRSDGNVPNGSDIEDEDGLFGDGNAHNGSDIEDDAGYTNNTDGQNDTLNARMFPVTDEERLKGQKVQFKQNKRILEQQADMKKQIKQLEQTVEGLLPKFPTAKLSWPVANINALKELEKGLRSSVAGLEEGLKAKMLKASRNSMLDFVKENLKKLFGQVGRFTWTGSIPKNAKHGEPSYKASGLACIETLIGCSSDAFGEDGEAIEKTIKKGFEQINEARHKLNERRRQEQNLQDHAPVSKPSSSNIVISGPTSGSAAISPTESKPSSVRPPSASKGLTMAVNTASSIKMDRSERNTNSSTPSKNGDIEGSSGEGPKRSIISTSSIKKDRSRPITTSATPSKIARKKTPSSSTAIDKMCDQFRAVPSHEAHSR